MDKDTKGRESKVGLPPGTLVHAGSSSNERVKMTLMDYDRNEFVEKQIDKISGVRPFIDKPSVTWINLDGIHQMDLIEMLGIQFGIDPLILEDIVFASQRPKIDEFPESLFIVLKMVEYDDARNELETEQISIILRGTGVISFQEKAGELFEPIRDRIRSYKGRIREMGADYLVYALVDTIVDHYFVVLDKLGERLDRLERSITTRHDKNIPHEVRRLKTHLLDLRKATLPLRDLLNDLADGGALLIQKNTLPYFRDVYHHVVQVMDTIEAYRELVTGLQETYMLSISNRTNEVMKTLTMIATIFMPLTFVAGLYGMNFDFLPLKSWDYGFASVLFLSAAIAAAFAIHFHRKKWM